MTNPVTAALTAVNYDAWVTDEHGDRVPQSSAAGTIERLLRLLDLHPAQRVMEIGTGSGYTAALLARAVGEHGCVISLDVEPHLVERASRLHQREHTHVEIHAIDGIDGWPERAPYDRIVGWTTPHLLPRSWVEQAAENAVLVTPVKLAPVANANAVVRCRISDGQPAEGTLRNGSFIEMAPDSAVDRGTPVRFVDAVLASRTGTQPLWLSATQLHEQPQEHLEQLLRGLDSVHCGPGFLDPADVPTFEGFLLASTARPATAGTRHGWGMGVATAEGIAVVVDGDLLAVGDAQAREELEACRQQWLAAGKPGFADLVPSFVRQDDGWLVRAHRETPA